MRSDEKESDLREKLTCTMLGTVAGGKCRPTWRGPAYEQWGSTKTCLPPMAKQQLFVFMASCGYY